MDFILRSVVEYNYGAQNTVIYEVKKALFNEQGFLCFTDLNYI